MTFINNICSKTANKRERNVDFKILFVNKVMDIINLPRILRENSSKVVNHFVKLRRNLFYLLTNRQFLVKYLTIIRS